MSNYETGIKTAEMLIKPCSSRFALDANQSFLTCRGVRGLFCSGHDKESGHVNTTVRVSSEK